MFFKMKDKPLPPDLNETLLANRKAHHEMSKYNKKKIRNTMHRKLQHVTSVNKMEAGPGNAIHRGSNTTPAGMTAAPAGIGGKGSLKGGKGS